MADIILLYCLFKQKTTAPWNIKAKLGDTFVALIHRFYSLTDVLDVPQNGFE